MKQWFAEHAIESTIAGSAVGTLLYDRAMHFLAFSRDRPPTLIIQILILVLLFLLAYRLHKLNKTSTTIVQQNGMLDSSIATLRSTIKKESEGLASQLKQLPLQLSTVDWTSDRAQHEVAIYRRMADIINDPLTNHICVFSILKPKAEPTSDTARAAAREYYAAIESAVNNKKAKYKRAVIVRRSIGGIAVSDDAMIRDAFTKRTELLAHYRQITEHYSAVFGEENVNIKIYADDGRIMDIAFAIFSHDERPQALVLEIEIYGVGDDRGVRGLLVMEPPDRALLLACRQAFDKLFSERDGLISPISTSRLKSLLPE
jgi:hypothetical protein